MSQEFIITHADFEIKAFFRRYNDRMPTEPWYRDGLSFRCTQCGDCCTGAPGFVWVEPDEVADIAQFRGETPEHVEAVYTRKALGRRSLRERAGGDCVFFEHGVGCTVYAARPRQCRTWPFWESNLETPADWKRTCEVCPGSGQGQLFSVEEITQRMKAVRV